MARTLAHTDSCSCDRPACVAVADELTIMRERLAHASADRDAAVELAQNALNEVAELSRRCRALLATVAELRGQVAA